MIGVFPELMLLTAFLMQLGSLGFLKGSDSKKFFYAIGALLLGFAFVLGIGELQISRNIDVLFSLSNEILFRPYRLLSIALVFIISRMCIQSKHIASPLARESVMIIIVVAVLLNLLILSKNYLLSVVLLSGIGLMGSLLIGLPYHDKIESIGIVRSFIFTVASIVISIFICFLFAMKSDSFDYDRMKLAFQNNQMSDQILLTFGLIPFFLFGGIFPFYQWAIDRAQAARWPIQAVLSIVVGGFSTIGLIKFVMIAASIQNIDLSKSIFSLISTCGSIGAIVCFLSSIPQENIKRHLAYFASGMWCFIMIPVRFCSPNGLASLLYYGITSMLSLTVLFWVMAKICEREGIETWNEFKKVRISRFELGTIIISLVSLLWIPPFSGFIGIVHLLFATFEAKSIVSLLSVGAVCLVMAISGLRIFRIAINNEMIWRGELDESFAKIELFDTCLLYALISLIIAAGVFWNSAYEFLSRHAALFINP